MYIIYTYKLYIYIFKVQKNMYVCSKYINIYILYVHISRYIYICIYIYIFERCRVVIYTHYIHNQTAILWLLLIKPID